jgi:hypothetical protein
MPFRNPWRQRGEYEVHICEQYARCAVCLAAPTWDGRIVIYDVQKLPEEGSRRRLCTEHCEQFFRGPMLVDSIDGGEECRTHGMEASRLLRHIDAASSKEGGAALRWPKP